MNLQIIFIFLSLSTTCYAANILVMLPLPLFSHTNNYMEIFKELAKKGHNVTMVSPYPQKAPIPNLNDIVTENVMQEFQDSNDRKDLVEMAGLLFDLFGFWVMFPELTERILQEKSVQQVIQDQTSSFDLIITETHFAHEPFIALGHKFNAPVITICAGGLGPSTAYLTGNHFSPSYIPNGRFTMSDKMTYLERVKNTFFYIWESYGSYFYYLRKHDSLMRKYFVYPGSENIPPLVDMLANIPLTLVESHFSLHYPWPLHNNIIEVGGINLKDGDKLPVDLQKYMDDAKDGVIYFSLGSHYKSIFLKSNVSSSIIAAFSKVKQKVIMKWEDVMPNKPDNIKIGKWFPQRSILGHPNCKLFVTHGGLHGITEGLFHGVPLLGIPLFGDQVHNLWFVEQKGAAVIVELSKVTEESIYNSINTILSNDQYKVNAMTRKALLRDRPIQPMDNAIYWIEYVIRHKGASHLRPASLDIPWYQYLLLDVAIFFVVAIGITLVITIGFIIIVVKCIKKMFCSKGDLVKKNIKNDNKTKKKSKKE